MRFRVAPWLSLLFAGAAVWLVFECRRTAEIAGWQEVQAREAVAAAATARQELDAARGALANAAADVRRLERELATAGTQLQAMADAVQQRAAKDEARALAAAAAQAQAMAPMPEGVRQCLAGLHECLRAEGFAQLRFVSARTLDGDGLHDVEVLDVQPDGFGVDLLRAERMTAQLDRGKGRLVLRFFTGSRGRGGEHEALPADGLPIVFAPIDGRLFEQRLPFLVRADGVYPADGPAGDARPASDLDPAARLQWLDRFDRLLGAAGTAEEWRVNRLRGLQASQFLTVQLLGTDQKHRLQAAIDCARLCVEVDRTAGVVSLLLQDGVLRREGVESTITAEGYRMLLPKVTPQQAVDVMLGMVVTK